MRIIASKAEDRMFVETVVRSVLSTCRKASGSWPADDSPEFRTLNRGGRAGVAVVTAEGRNCCVKFFYDTRWFVKWRNRIGFSKAGRAFRKGRELKLRGVNCPAMIGYAVDRRSGLAVLITEWAETAQRVDYWIEKYGADAGTARALGRFIGWMHDAGVTHKDLSLRNLLIQPVPGGYGFLLLDYEDARFSVAVTRQKRLRNLHHLNERSVSAVPENIRREFLAAYLGGETEISGWCDSLNRMIEDNPSKYTQASGPEGKADV